MPLQATSGAASYDAFGGGVPVVPNYIEDVFSCFVYTGTSAARDIVNGIDLAGKGGLAWIKCRTVAESNSLFTTNLGANKTLLTDATDAQDTVGTDVFQSFNSDGFRVGSHGRTNESPRTYASWTFRKQPKFFDVVTYTGNGSARTIAHNLGSAPGCIIVKATNATESWYVYHRSSGNSNALNLNNTNAEFFGSGYWNGTNPTSTVFSVGTDLGVNGSGVTYVAYLFAHNAGGFGLTGTDNVISCGSFTTDGSGTVPNVNLGYEPQWLLWKNTQSADNWQMLDNMRGFAQTLNAYLQPNNSSAEQTANSYLIKPSATGFYSDSGTLSSSQTYIYIAIRRGPMKVPTVGTSVFSPNTATGSALVTTNFPVDASISSETGASTGATWGSRLQGTKQYLLSYNTGAEASFGGNGWGFSNNTGLNQALYGGSTPSVFWNFQRAPGYMDEVCYTGDGGYVSRSHNLAAVPEMMIVKARSTTSNWSVYHSALGFENYVRLNTTAASAGTGDFWYQTPTTTQFSVGGYTEINDTGVNYLAYLFATAPGVSKVTSFTGNGSSQTINCGFTAGSRFVMIKRTDSTGDWYVWDSARGIVSGNDPHLSLNSTAAEVTTDDTIDTDSTGFIVNQVSATNSNVNGASYIVLAIA